MENPEPRHAAVLHGSVPFCAVSPGMVPVAAGEGGAAICPSHRRAAVMDGNRMIIKSN